VAGHHTRLTADDGQNAPVAEDNDRQYDDVERDEIPDSVYHLDDIALPDHHRVAGSVHHGRRGEVDAEAVDQSPDPRESHRHVRHPLAHPLLAPRVMNHLQIAIDGDDDEPDPGAGDSPPGKRLAEQRGTQPVTRGSRQADVAQLHRVGYDQKDAAEQIKRVDVHDQHMFLVLLGGHQGVQDDRVGCRSHNSDDHDSALEIEIGTT